MQGKDDIYVLNLALLLCISLPVHVTSVLGLWSSDVLCCCIWQLQFSPLLCS
jgi:hypothetical protein